MAEKNSVEMVLSNTRLEPKEMDTYLIIRESIYKVLYHDFVSWNRRNATETLKAALHLEFMNPWQEDINRCIRALNSSRSRKSLSEEAFDSLREFLYKLDMVVEEAERRNEMRDSLNTHLEEIADICYYDRYEDDVFGEDDFSLSQLKSILKQIWSEAEAIKETVIRFSRISAELWDIANDNEDKEDKEEWCERIRKVLDQLMSYKEADFLADDVEEIKESIEREDYEEASYNIGALGVLIYQHFEEPAKYKKTTRYLILKNIYKIADILHEDLDWTD